jgi:hypothetical protein
MSSSWTGPDSLRCSILAPLPQAHSSLAHAEATPISAAIGFASGFALGVRH